MEQTSGKTEISCGVIPQVDALCLLKQLWGTWHQHTLSWPKAQFPPLMWLSSLPTVCSPSKELKPVKKFSVFFFTKKRKTSDIVNSFSQPMPHAMDGSPCTEPCYVIEIGSYTLCVSKCAYLESSLLESGKDDSGSRTASVYLWSSMNSPFNQDHASRNPNLF